MNSLATTPTATPQSTESFTRISDLIGDQQQIDDQYRPMTLGEEEILRIHEEGIYRTPDMIELSGGLWITGDPRGSCSLKTAPIQDAVEMEDLDLELEELLRDFPGPGTPLIQPPAPDYPYHPGVV